jgi:hypothetical protein
MEEKDLKAWAELIGLAAASAVLLTAKPLLLLWSINTLFRLDIEITPLNWLAALALLAVAKPRFSCKGAE